MTPAAHTIPKLSYEQWKKDPRLFEDNLRRELTQTGFFILTDVDSVVSKEAWDAAFAATEAFFDLSDAEKDSISMNNSRHFRGYSSVGHEKTQNRVDLREQIDFGPEFDPARISESELAAHPYLNLYGLSQFPDASLPEFRKAYDAFVSGTATIGREILTAIAQSVTLDASRITDQFFGSKYPAYFRLKTVRYPSLQSVPEDVSKNAPYGVGPHKDSGGLTVLAQPSVGGLQVQTWAGNWIDVPPQPYAFVINIGQVLENATASYYRATTHRVLANSSLRDRLSIPYFLSPALDGRNIPLRPDELSPAAAALLPELSARPLEISDVPAGDLHAQVYGDAAWRGFLRSHVDVADRWYSTPSVKA